MLELKIGDRVKYEVKTKGISYLFLGTVTKYMGDNFYRISGFDKGGFPIFFDVKPSDCEPN